MRIYVLFNNYSSNTGLLADWGFSALVETGRGNILFDTGSNGPVLVENMRRLGLRADEIKQVVISHDHWDHVGGLTEIARLNKGLLVHTPGLNGKLAEELERLHARISVTQGETRVSDFVHTSRVFEDFVNEIALVCETSRGKIILTGCSHPGILKILKAIPGPRYLLVGGLHLFRASIGKIYQVSRGLDELGIKFLAPSHCTGEEVISYLKECFLERVLYGGLGAVFSF